MKSITAKDAKNKFGELMDTVQREPVTIEKYGRAVAVVLSNEEYKQLKLERLRAYLAVGEEQADRGEFADYSLDKVIAELDCEKRKPV